MGIWREDPKPGIQRAGRRPWGSPRCPPASVSPPAGPDCPNPIEWRSKSLAFPGAGRGASVGSPSQEDAPHRGRAEGPPAPGQPLGGRARAVRAARHCGARGAASLGPVTARPGGPPRDSQPHPPCAADAPRAGPRPSQPAGRAGGRAHSGDAGLPPGHRSQRLSLPLLHCVPATPAGRKTYPVEAVSSVLTGQGRRRRGPGWPISVEVPWQNPAGPEQQKPRLPPPLAAPAQGSPRSARPCDLRAAERLQPPKLHRGWGLEGEGKKAPTDGQPGKSRVAPPPPVARTGWLTHLGSQRFFIPSGGHTGKMYSDETSRLFAEAFV